jgi:hypothetical protein
MPMRMSRDMIATAFRFTRWAILTFAMLTVMAMLLYPGGAFRDPNTQHYLFLRNFLSDLGMPTSWGGHANRLGALLFVSGEILFASALIAFSVALISLCSSSPGQRRWARAAAVAGVAAGVGFIGGRVDSRESLPPAPYAKRLARIWRSVRRSAVPVSNPCP